MKTKLYVLNKKYAFVSFIFIFLLIVGLIIQETYKKNPLSVFSQSYVWEDKQSENQNKNNYIKWVDFSPTYQALSETSKIDIESHNNDNSSVQYNWIELLSYLACQYGGNFKNYKSSDLKDLCDKLSSGNTIDDLTKNLKHYTYYYEAFDAVLHEYIGYYEVEENSPNSTVKYLVQKYGLKVFSPIAKNYSYSHYDDFGNSRSYGYKRRHLGHDLMGSIGTPIIAMESGTIEAIGWNQYGGWRIGIRSFDKKRYYYYAHLRKDHPYAQNFNEGDTVNSGDVIGYLGMTGYSSNENVNNINVPHLHLGVQLIFDESQKDGTNQIWIDLYNIIEFLKSNSVAVYKNSNSGEFCRLRR